MLVWLLVSIALAQDCLSSAPLPTEISVDTDCAEANLAVSVETCAGECTGDPIWYWLVIGNDGQADAPAFVAEALREGQNDSLTPVVSTTVSGLQSGRSTVLGPYALQSAAERGDGLLLRVDAAEQVVQCATDDDSAELDPEPLIPDSDGDDDGYDAVACGGLDCADDDASRNPGADEITDDGTDQDCDGSDGTSCDLDGDGFDALACGGLDCNDDDGTIHPDADDPVGDGIDQDCDGIDCENEPWAQGGAGCSSAPGPASGLLLLLPLLATRRRS